MRLTVDVEATDGPARRRHGPNGEGIVLDPAFMPVGTRGSIRALSTHELASVRASDGSSAEILLANTYHLMLRPGADVVADLGGLHRFSGWDGLHLTDSGGLPGVLAGARRSPTRGPRFRVDVRRVASTAHAGGGGRDPGTARCRHPDGARRVRTTAVGPPRSWRRRSTERRSGPAGPVRRTDGRDDQALFGIVQGGTTRTCARESAERTSALDFDGYGIGGLSVGETRDEMLPGARLCRSPFCRRTSRAT